MFPAKGIKLNIITLLFSLIFSLILILQISFLSFALMIYDFSKKNSNTVHPIKTHNYEAAVSSINNSKTTLHQVNDLSGLRNYNNNLSVQKMALTTNEQVNNDFKSEKLQLLADRYQADPEYLNFIIKVEKTFKLDPCELLALIALESGFKPQTRMDGGSLSYSTTQMKLATAQTAYMAITKYYKMNIIPPTHELLQNNPYYAAFLAGGYLRYLYDVYKNKDETYTAYNWGIGGRMLFYQKNGHFRSAYAVKLSKLRDEFRDFIGKDYNLLGK